MSILMTCACLHHTPYRWPNGFISYANPMENIVNIHQWQAVCSKQKKFVAEMGYVDGKNLLKFTKKSYECLIFRQRQNSIKDCFKT